MQRSSKIWIWSVFGIRQTCSCTFLLIIDRSNLGDSTIDQLLKETFEKHGNIAEAVRSPLGLASRTLARLTRHPTGHHARQRYPTLARLWVCGFRSQRGSLGGGCCFETGNVSTR